MARVAKELGFTTMSLYRHVASKEELLQLMWDASATGAETLVLEGRDWREKLRMWSVIQREMMDRHPWITQMPMAAPPLAPNSMHFVEHGLSAFDGTGLPAADRMRVLGLISSYTLSDARMANDAARAVKKALEAEGRVSLPDQAKEPLDPTAMPSYEALLRELIDEPTFPRLYRMAWADESARLKDEHTEFLLALEIILDGVQALIKQSPKGSPRLS